MKRLALTSVLFLATHLILASNPEKTMLLHGRVIDDLTKLPVITSLSIYVEGFKPFKILTNKQGQFTANLPVAPECRIVARAPGFDTQDDQIIIPMDKEGTPDFIEITLTPWAKLTLNGMIRAEKGNQPVDGELHVYWNSDFIEIDAKKICDGKFSEVLPRLGWYLVDFSAPGYESVLDTFWVVSCSRKTLTKDYALKPKTITAELESITIGPEAKIELRNIQFNFSKATLTPGSYTDLNSIATFLTKNPSVQVEIGGHTDTEGPDDYNLLLSEQRAQAVTRYLIAQGVRPGQLMARGYGETKPVTTNDTELGKSQNRRVEMTVLKK
jgi:OOP family OmpA-OmpF porin